MKETVAARRTRAVLSLPEDVAGGFSGLSAQVRARSLIVWSEHCSECAYPACYSACAFYAPRADLHCSRFVHGIEPLAAPPKGVRLHRVVFRKWGKLEGRGPARLRSAAAAEAAEGADDIVGGLLARTPAPYEVARSLAWRWNDRKIARAEAGGRDADAFVVEAWACDGREHPFTMTFLEEEGGRRMFQAPFVVGAGYSRLVVPAGEIGARVDLDRPYVVQLEPVGDAEGREVVFGLCDFAAFKGVVPASVQPASAATAATAATAAVSDRPVPVKLVVWDLDETLWDGTLAEDGIQGLRLRREAAATVRALDERGVLQSIASKNDPDEAQGALRAFGLADYFLAPQAGWGPKSGLVRAVAETLDVGLDTVVFVDDQAFERAEVTAVLPQVRALPHTAAATLADDLAFDLPLTAEGRKRRLLYRVEAQRAAAYRQAGADYLGFLRDCRIVLDVAPLGPADLDRVYELSQRTNQLNFTGAKLSQAEVAALARPGPDRACLTLRCADRFGDYGLIGFAVLDEATGELAEFFMSCRVQRKTVENAFFAYAAQRLADRGVETLSVRFHPTERNGKGAEMLRDLGFAGEAPSLQWRRPTAEPFENADVATVRAFERPAQAA